MRDQSEKILSVVCMGLDLLKHKTVSYIKNCGGKQSVVCVQEPGNQVFLLYVCVAGGLPQDRLDRLVGFL